MPKKLIVLEARAVRAGRVGRIPLRRRRCVSYGSYTVISGEGGHGEHRPPSASSVPVCRLVLTPSPTSTREWERSST
ncbi:hypothetical protein EVAR_29538_1 [Eumeta japonica]|uniref:Uncharacterized protein n=1 Tax=Eumeta variegata TaxID=151549 RepID=A0A4C1WIK0_EUMVA|nr:hypothetical protein EVAR_29538_1 [Eumeta japonica]